METNTAWTRPHVLREYALVADGERGALIGPHGDLSWLCAPHWDSPAVFSAMLGGRGCYVVTPSDPWYVWGGYYEEGSLIWRSRWVTSEGAVECREALAMPSDPHRVVVLRRVDAVDRTAAVTALLDPRAEFGRKGIRQLRRVDGHWVARVGDLYLRWTGAEDATETDDGLRLDLQVPPGTTHDLVLELSDRPLPDPVEPGRLWEETATEWSRRVPALGTAIGEEDARQAYAVLSGLTARSGGMVAAATMSLPERAHSGRNYDYRYCWLRDQSYAGRAVAASGAHPLLDDAVDFVSARLLDDGVDLLPAYAADGSRVPAETPVPSLIGYPGGGNMRGNHIDAQFQLDTFGEALLLFAAAARRDRLDSNHWKAAEIAVRAIAEHHTQPGAGLWELAPERWTHSRLTCAAGLRAVAASAPPAQSAEWMALADHVVAEAGRDSVHPSGRWQRSPSDPKVDASLILPVIRGGVAPDDPRSIATLEAVLDQLVSHGYVYRFRHDERPLHAAEGAFLMCGFTTALALHQQGREVEARAFYERTRSACGPPGLFSEEFDVRQHQLRGNLPQAFVHALMLEASVRLAGDWVPETHQGRD